MQEPPAGPARPVTRNATGFQLAAASFEQATGLLRSIAGIPVKGPELGLWRAPTDNDLGRDFGDPQARSDADAWRESGLPLLRSRTVSIEADAEVLTVVRRSGVPGLDHAVDATYRWSAGGDGLRLDLEVQPSGRWPGGWARIGIDLTLPEELSEVSWTGLGPGPKYPDTGQSQRWGWFTATVDELQVDHPRPQENGVGRG